jgi:hypothetical protein
MFFARLYTVKKVNGFPGPSGDVLPSRENLVSDIPAGDGKKASIFYSVMQEVVILSL